MRVLPYLIRKQRIDDFNTRQSQIERSRTYIPLEIDERTDTTSSEWHFHCLILNIINRPTQADRDRQLALIQEKSPIMYQQLMTEIPKREQEYFG